MGCGFETKHGDENIAFIFEELVEAVDMLTDILDELSWKLASYEEKEEVDV